MWNSLSKRFTNSFLYESEDITHYYLKTEFINKLYFYYCKNGYYNIISTQIVNILITSFTLFIVIFLFNCVDYDSIIDIREDTHLYEVVNMKNFFQLNGFYWCLLIIFMLFIACKIFSLLDDIVSFKAIKNYYKDTLKIKDSQLSNTSWENIVEKMNKYYHNQDINPYTINNKIMIQDNYFIALIDKEMFRINYLTKLMEWNLRYTIIHYMFDENIKLRKDILINKTSHIESIKTRITLVSIVNFIFMPLIMGFMIFYSLFEYCEKFYNKPELIKTRSWTKLALWKFREYNETYHIFHERIKKANKSAVDYTNQFHSRLLETFSHLVVFIAGTFFTILIFLSIINENILIKLYISDTKTVIWFLGILATIITFFRTMINDRIMFYPNKYMKELRKHISLFPESWENLASTKMVKQNFLNFYQYKLTLLFKEIFMTLLVPFDLYSLNDYVDDIVTFIQINTKKDGQLGLVCRNSIFRNFYNTNLAHKDEKTRISYENFKKNYPDWSKKYEYYAQNATDNQSAKGESIFIKSSPTMDDSPNSVESNDGTNDESNRNLLII